MKQECAEKFLNLFRRLSNEDKRTIVKLIKKEGVIK